MFSFSPKFDVFGNSFKNGFISNLLVTVDCLKSTFLRDLHLQWKKPDKEKTIATKDETKAFSKIHVKLEYVSFLEL